jgi:hypothetical protein
MNDTAIIEGVIAVAWALFVTFFWMYIAWRAMRAHERLAKNSDEVIQAIRTWFREKRENEKP